MRYSKKIKVRIPKFKQKFYRQCVFDDLTWKAIRYYHKHKRDLIKLEKEN